MVRLLIIVGLLLSGAVAFAEPPGRPTGDCKLIYSPTPQYPAALRRAYFPIQGKGTFSVSFDASGKVKEVKMVRSTGDYDLDEAAISTLRRWKSAPGRTCTVLVPVKFHPGHTTGF